MSILDSIFEDENYFKKNYIFLIFSNYNKIQKYFIIFINSNLITNKDNNKVKSYTYFKSKLFFNNFL